MKKVLAIAGSDCSGGAGIQADIKTICAHKLYAMTAITALTAQNTTGVYGIFSITPEFVAQQLTCIFTDIMPDSVKIGMVSDGEVIQAIADQLLAYKVKNIVIDPVMVSTSGSRLMQHDATRVLVERLFPLGTVITPNIPEAEVLSGISIKSEDDMQRASALIAKTTKGGVLVKGGHLSETATDILYEHGEVSKFYSNRIDTTNTHGTGCTLSSAIACGLANGLSVKDSIANAKRYLSGALAAGLNLGNGSGPVDHLYAMK